MFMKKMKCLLFMLVVLLLFLTISCKKDTKKSLNDCSIEHETEFGGIYVHKTIEQFNELGFEYGDSVDISFSNGKELNDIPYYNGYYTKNGEVLLVAYPGYPYIKVCINNGDDLWERIGVLQGTLNSEKKLLWDKLSLNSDTTVNISLNEKGKYKDVQEARDIHYSDDINDYPSSASNYVFANFRSLKGGRLKENIVFRSASPCDNQHNRSKYVDNLIESVGIKYVLNLADNDQKINGYMAKDDFSSNYFKSLYENNKVLPLALNMNFESSYFKAQTIKALSAISEHEGPYLLHCTEGKDRTGFLCILIEALAGASYREIVEDYMTTYFNYYSLLGEFDSKKYDVIVSNVLNPMIDTITDSNDYDNISFRDCAYQYLLSNGMERSLIEEVESRICE